MPTNGTRVHVRCPCCGSNRAEDAYTGALPDPAVMIQEWGGYKVMKWTQQPLTLRFAQALRVRLAAALERLDAELED